MFQIISLVTVYFPNKGHVSNIKLIAKQSDKVIICDNSSDSNEKLFSEIKNAKYIANMENLGISGAFNRAIVNNDIDWHKDDMLVFFDQDSVIPKNHIEKLIHEFNALTKQGHLIGCLGPVYYNTSHKSVELPKLYETIDKVNFSVSSLMTSSMVTQYHIIESIGFWNDEVFLDFADWDICWRMRERGYLCVMSYASILQHSIGEGEKKIGPITLRVAKPIREYYETRDCQYLLRKKYIPLKYKVRFHLILTLRPLLHLLFLNNKKERLYYIKLGIKDYKKNVHGALDTDKMFNNLRSKQCKA